MKYLNKDIINLGHCRHITIYTIPTGGVKKMVYEKLETLTHSIR